MSVEDQEKAKQEIKEWARYVSGVLKEVLERLPPESERLREMMFRVVNMLNRYPEYNSHFCLFAAARLAVALPHLASNRSILPDPAKAEEWVKTLLTYKPPAERDFLAWKASTAIKLARKYAQSRVPEYAMIVRGMQYMRRDGVSKVISSLIEIDRQLAAEIAPDQKRLRFWLEELEQRALKGS